MRFKEFIKENVNEADPKVGTGKKPKGSDRRLYTDENPKDTVSIKFATPADAKATVAKVKNIKKPYRVWSNFGNILKRRRIYKISRRHSGGSRRFSANMF